MRQAREVGTLEPVNFRAGDFLQDLGREYNELVLHLRTKDRKSENSESGFSLIEMMVVMGLMTIVGFGGMQMMSRIFKSQSGMTTAVSVIDLQADIRGLVGVVDVCTLNFKDRIVSPGMAAQDVTQILAADSTVRFAPNGIYESNSLKILGMSLSDYQEANPTNGTANLNIRLQKLKNTGESPSIIRKVPLFVKVENGQLGKKIVSCYAGGGSGGSGVST